MNKLFLVTLIVATLFITACNDNSGDGSNSGDSTSTAIDTARQVNIKEENVNVAVDTTEMQCHVAYNENKTGGRPIVLVVPEWWGVTDFTKNKARQLAELGYFALVVDMYGRGKTADNPDAALAAATPFYSNPQMASGRLYAALTKAKSYFQADSSRTAAIGFCFGGSMVLNAAKLGIPLDGVVSFHGGLQGVPPKKNTVKSKILVLNGAADPFVPAKDVSAFKKQLDSAGVPYTFKDYPGALHAFTNPQADELGKKFKMPVAYNADADRQSWEEMKNFLNGLWQE
jgi:dienelactone hydrolase